MDERIWDFTRIDYFLTCRRKYYWRMIRHLTPKTVAPALEFGGATHDALNAYYVGGSDLTKALDMFKEGYRDREGEEIRTVANGVKMLEHYAIIYKHEPFTIVGKPEVGFVFPIGEVLWGGRMDLPVDWDGDLYVVEHKTTTRLTSNYFKQFDLDFQTTGYTVAAEEYLGRKCLGCIINVLEPWKELKRPTARSKRPEDHFARDPKPKTQLMKDMFKRNVQLIIKDVLECERKNEFYESCKKEVCLYYNTECPYKQLCMYGENERFIEKDYNVEEWKPYEEVKKDG